MQMILAILLIVMPIFSFALEKHIICAPPQGSRVDYFSLNSANVKNETFLMSKDGVSGMQPQITLSDNNHDVLFVIGDTAGIKSPSKSVKMTVMAYNDEQISFTGVVNEAPILATYYPKLNILIYSQQSTWSNENFQGARAMLFYSKCSG